MRRVLLLIAVLALLPAPAAARGSGDAVLRDCTTHGHLTKRYKAADYQDALVNIPADVREYGTCDDVIRRAQLKVVGHVSGGPGIGSGPAGAQSSSGGLPTPILVLLILIAVGAVAAAAVAVRSRARRNRDT